MEEKESRKATGEKGKTNASEQTIHGKINIHVKKKQEPPQQTEEPFVKRKVKGVATRRKRKKRREER